jgi:hypothetical protein
MEAFHQSLYLLHHYYIPQYDVTKIRALSDSLELKSALLMKARIPERLAKKSRAFDKARTNLCASVQAFSAAVNAGKPKTEIVRLEDALHANYELLDKVFE